MAQRHDGKVVLGRPRFPVFGVVHGEELAQPLQEGLTRPGGMLGGGNPAYNVYPASEGWIAIAALEPHFEKKLGDKFALGRITHEALAALFASHDAEYWEEWGRRNDIPIVAVRETTES